MREALFTRKRRRREQHVEELAPDHDAVVFLDRRAGRNAVILVADVALKLAERDEAVVAYVTRAGRGGVLRQVDDQRRPVGRAEVLEANNVLAVRQLVEDLRHDVA